MNKNKRIKDARNELESVSGDYEIRRIAELKEKAIRDEKAALAYAKEEGFDKGYEEGMEKGMQAGINKGIEQGIEKGIEQGIQKGIEKSIEKVVKNMLKEKMDVSIISKITGISENKINALK